MKKIAQDRIKVMRALKLGAIAVRNKEDTFMWRPRTADTRAVSLRSEVTGSLFQADYVCERDGQLALTALGLYVLKTIELEGKFK